MPVARLCSVCNRPFLPSEGRRGRCLEHAKEHERRRTERRRRDTYYGQVLSSPQWRRTREHVRKRDVVCQRQDRWCHGRLEVHHVVKVDDGGAPFDPENLVLLRQHHHARSENRRAGVVTR